MNYRWLVGFLKQPFKEEFTLITMPLEKCPQFAKSHDVIIVHDDREFLLELLLKPAYRSE